MTVTERRLPPIGELAVVSLALIIAGGVYLAANIPDVPLTVPSVLLAVSAAILAFNAIALARVRDFAWPTFFRVAGWTAVAYTTIAVLLGWVLVLDDLHGGALVVTLLSLAVYAIDVPLILGFGVARFQPAGT